MVLPALVTMHYTIFVLLIFSSIEDSLVVSQEVTAAIISSPTVLEPISSFKFNFVCNRKAATSTLKFELYTSDHVLFTKTYPCLSDSQVTHQLDIKVPDSYVFNYDLYQRKMKFDAQCLAALSISEKRASSFVKTDSLVLPVKPVYSRPFKTHRTCLTFIGEMALQISTRVIPQCPLDNDVIHFLHKPVVFNEQFLGVIKALPRVNNLDLKQKFEENKNLLTELTVNLYVYLLSYPEDRASLFHHMTVGGHIFATSPLLLVMSDGHLLVEIPYKQQVQSFLCHSYLVLKKWYYLNLMIDSERVGSLSVCNVTENGVHPNECFTCVYHFDSIMQFSPYANSFVVGGSLIFSSPSGYIAGVEIILNKAVKAITRSSESSPVMEVEISHFDSQCSKFVERVWELMTYYKYEVEELSKARQCGFSPWKRVTHVSRNVCRVKPKMLQKHNFIQDIVRSDVYGQLKSDFFRERREDDDIMFYKQGKQHDLEMLYMQDVGKRLYLKSRNSLGIGLHEVKHGLIPYILQASCLGYGIASYMAAVIHFTGFGVSMDERTGSFYLTRSALLNDRLGLLSLGFKYTYGLNGYPIDLPIAWRYYIQAAMMFHDDREEHKETDVYTEHVRLTDKKELEVYRGKKSDHFEWLKFQASQGVESAKQELSQMLFWGSKGVNRDMAAAVQYYRQLALAGDVNAHYDLGIALIRGQGGEVNVEEALRHLNAAAEHGHQKAVGALGWHHLLNENYELAFKYLQMGAEKGDTDSMHNLGYLYDRGLTPDGYRNNSAAYIQYIRAAHLGHPTSSIAVSVGLIYGDGIMLQDPVNAVGWARGVAEELTDVGKLLRQGLQAYLEDRLSEALMFYMMAAETGVEVASFNMAYLCENDHQGLSSSYIDSECIYKYYNMSLNSYTPHVYAINKMGDYYFFGCSGKPIDASKAASYYLWAAQLGDPQAYYNLAYLINLGYEISPLLESSDIRIPKNVTSSSHNLQLYLFEACQQIETKATDDESLFSPCMIAKYSWLVGIILEQYWFQIKVGSFIFATAITLILCQLSVHRENRTQNNSLVAGV